MLLYRVLTLALLCAPSTVMAAPISGGVVGDQYHGLESPALVARLRAASLGGASPDPFLLDDGHEMWDPLGAGCIDAAEPAAWLADGKRNPEAGAICLPKPCARLLIEEEMEGDVLGRPLREGEWETYTRRFAKACSRAVRWDGNEEVRPLDLLPAGAAPWGADGYSRSLSAFGAGGTNPRGRDAFSGGRGGFGGDPSVERGGGGSGLVDRVKPSSPAPKPADETFPGASTGGETPRLRDPSVGGADGGGADPMPQPTPVPLPGALLMLVTAVGALRLMRR